MAKILIKVLSLLFGIGSWIAITGLWLEMPVLIDRLPERWSLASDMNLVIQLANVGPLLCYLCRKFKLINDAKASHLLLVIGFLSCVVLIFAWDKTLYIFGMERSVVLFIATFGLALLDCASSVTFLPFMARFDIKYLTPYLIGEGLSGFIPTVFALIQGIEPTESCQQIIHNNTSDEALDNKMSETKLRFSAGIFFASLLVTLVISWLALILLQVLPICKRESRISLKNRNESQKPYFKRNKDNGKQKSKNSLISRSKYYYLLSLIFFSCLSTFGFMPSIQPYSCLPYGNLTLHYVVILTGLSFPFGCFLAMIFHKQKSTLRTSLLTVFGHLIAVYIIICALLSPSPPFISNLSLKLFGSLAMIFAWIVFTVCLSYTKTMITLIISECKGEDGLFWVGFQTQLGAFFGATLMFVLVNYTNIFHESKCNN